MQNTTALFDSIFLNPKHYTEARLDINGVSYYEDTLKGITTYQSVFSGNGPIIGSCVSSEIDVQMLIPDADIPRMAKLRPYVRITDGTRYSEWLPKGVYYIDTRSKNADTITLHGYDAMLKGEQEYFGANLSWPNIDINVVNDIASIIGVDLDERTTYAMTRGYTVELPAGYTCRETLGFIAAMYCGCFVISDSGELRLIRLNEMPEDTGYLVDRNGNPFTFGGDHIIVG